MRTLILLLTGLVALSMSACDIIDSKKCPEGTDSWIEYQLYMGRGGPSGEVVDQDEWDQFLADTVTPRFPDGLTVLDGRGQWRGSDGAIQKESSKVLIILAPDEYADDLIEEISDEYKRRFNQDAVLKTVSQTCTSF